MTPRCAARLTALALIAAAPFGSGPRVDAQGQGAASRYTSRLMICDLATRSSTLVHEGTGDM